MNPQVIAHFTMGLAGRLRNFIVRIVMEMIMAESLRRGPVYEHSTVCHETIPGNMDAQSASIWTQVVRFQSGCGHFPENPLPVKALVRKSSQSSYRFWRFRRKPHLHSRRFPHQEEKRLQTDVKLSPYVLQRSLKSSVAPR